jgi:hypothetical protein
MEVLKTKLVKNPDGWTSECVSSSWRIKEGPFSKSRFVNLQLNHIHRVPTSPLYPESKSLSIEGKCVHSNQLNSWRGWHAFFKSSGRQNPPHSNELLLYKCEMVLAVIHLQRPLTLLSLFYKLKHLSSSKRLPVFCSINPFPLHISACHFSLYCVTLIFPFPFTLPYSFEPRPQKLLHVMDVLTRWLFCFINIPLL